VPPSLYKPELKRELAQEQRRELGLELANEATMWSNSRRFNVSDAFDKRARWLEEEAVTYRIADLIQQIMEIRATDFW
jgi:hypothetical protein